MDPGSLLAAIAKLPAGPWAVGVSGGADSIALLLLLHDRPDLSLHIVHLDHQTRHGESTRDAEFVADLAAKLQLPCTLGRRSDIESTIADAPKNLPTRYRAARFELFRRVVEAEKLNGVVLAHHADDQAETVLMRILRGASLSNIAGIRPIAAINGLLIHRPLLDIPGNRLRELLTARGQNWREDASNQSDQYQRNRVRQWLRNRPAICEALLRLPSQCGDMRAWLESAAPTLEPNFKAIYLSNLPPPLARHAAASWLSARGVRPDEITRHVCDRLIAMATDAATAPRQHFPGPVLVHRRRGIISTYT